MPNSEFIVEPIEPGVFPPGTSAWKTYWVGEVIDAVRDEETGVWFVPDENLS